MFRLSLGSFSDGVLDGALKNCEAVVHQVCDGWAVDLKDLCSLISSYVPQGWQMAKDKILQKDNAQVLQALVDNPHKTKMGKGAALVHAWTKMLRQLNVDGTSPIFSAESLHTWQQVEADALECFEFTEGCMTITRELPLIRNKPQRVAAAKKYKAGKKYDLGADLKARLELLQSPSFETEKVTEGAEPPSDAAA